MNLDLSKAVDAGGDALRDSFDDLPWWLNCDDKAQVVIDAALPHILDALAAGAQGESDNGFMRESDEVAEVAAKWLRAKAEEARA